MNKLNLGIIIFLATVLVGFYLLQPVFVKKSTYNLVVPNGTCLIEVQTTTSVEQTKFLKTVGGPYRVNVFPIQQFNGIDGTVDLNILSKKYDFLSTSVAKRIYNGFSKEFETLPPHDLTVELFVAGTNLCSGTLTYNFREYFSLRRFEA